MSTWKTFNQRNALTWPPKRSVSSTRKSLWPLECDFYLVCAKSRTKPKRKFFKALYAGKGVFAWPITDVTHWKQGPDISEKNKTLKDDSEWMDVRVELPDQSAEYLVIYCILANRNTKELTSWSVSAFNHTTGKWDIENNKDTRVSYWARIKHPSSVRHINSIKKKLLFPNKSTETLALDL